MQITMALLFIAVLGIFCRDYVFTSAVLCVLALHLVKMSSVTSFLQKQSLHIGIFFLVLFLLLPLLDDKWNFIELGYRLFSVEGIIAIVAGVCMSYIASKGVGVLSTDPVVFLGVLIGTLTAVLFLDGLPAGLIIAGGVFYLIQKLI